MASLHLAPIGSNIQINANGGAYTSGKEFPLEKKLEVASVYENHRLEAVKNGRFIPSKSAVAREAGVSIAFVTKIEQELNLHGQVLPPSNRKRKRGGVGADSLSEEDEAVLYHLYQRNPFRTRRNYCVRLRQITGTVVSESTITRFFLNGFPIKGSLRKPDMIPVDKFKPENIIRYFEFVEVINQINPKQIKFGNEKLLKGSEVYNKKGRRDPITGEVLEHIVNSDFRNTYSITGFCGIDKKTNPMSFVIHEAKNDATSFGDAVIDAIAEGFLRRGDVLVLDNAAIHFQGDNAGIEDGLWEDHGIAVLSLPTRSPELNPIELVWRSLTMKLRSIRVRSGSHQTAKAAARILANMSHNSIKSTYRECGYI